MLNNVQKAKAVVEIKCVALGDDVAEVDVIEVANNQPKTTEEKIVSLEDRISDFGNALDSVFTMVKELRGDINKEVDHKITAVIEENKRENKIEVPEGTILTGITKGLSYFLHAKDGGFYVGITRYGSLSAAAEGVSGVRRSGWTFWKLPDGKTVKETFKG